MEEWVNIRTCKRERERERGGGGGDEDIFVMILKVGERIGGFFFFVKLKEGGMKGRKG